MTSSRQRVLAAASRKAVDHIPVDLWHTEEVLAELRKQAGCDDALEVYARLGIDKVVWVFPDYPHAGGSGAHDGELRSSWGVPLRSIQAGAATYFESGTAPLLGYDTIESLDRYPYWPDPAKFDYAGTTAQAQRASQRFVTLGPWVSLFEIYCQLRGLEQAMIDIATEEAFVSAVLERIEAIQTEMMNRFFAAAGDALDWVFVSDDMGGQTGLLISLSTWRHFFQRPMQRWCNLIHRHGKKVFFHSDGGVDPLIGPLIDCGIDILNPIQHRCPGMEMRHLKRQYGKDLVFHGGVENQQVLPFGSTQEVRQEVLRCIADLGPDGFILCSCHNVQAGTPIANVLEMIRTARQTPVGG